MAPQSQNIENSLQSLTNQEEMAIEPNKTESRPVTKRPATAGDLNERSRKLIKSCFGKLRSNLNVLVIGPRESGMFIFVFLNFGQKASISLDFTQSRKKNSFVGTLLCL